MHDSRTWRQRTGVKTLSPPPHSTSLLYYPSEFRNRKGTGHTRKNTENTRWKHHHGNFNRSAQYVDTATTLLPCNRAPATNGQSTNMTSQTHVNVPTKHADTTAVQHRQHHGNTAVIPRSFKMNNVEYICTKCFENFATEHEYNFHWENNHPVDCEMEMLSLWNGFRKALWTLCP